VDVSEQQMSTRTSGTETIRLDSEIAICTDSADTLQDEQASTLPRLR
jgi:hypothetical protein